MREINRLQPLLLLAGLKIAVAVMILVWALVGPGSGLGSALLLAQVASLAAAGMLLIVGGRHDRRAVHLGFVCLLLAAALTPQDLKEALCRDLEHPWSMLVFALATLRLEVFLAPLVSLFVRDFPSVPLSFRLRSWVDRFIFLSWVAAIVLIAGHLVWLILASQAGLSDVGPDPMYVPSMVIVVAFALTALSFLGWKAYRSAGDEARRGRVFMMAAGGSVFAIAALVSLMGADAAFEWPVKISLLAVNAVLVAIPFTIAYAVLVERILDVRGIARRAVQHTLTRSMTWLAIAAPFALLVAFLYQDSRDLELVSRHLLLLAVAAVGFAGLRYRRQMLDAVDRHFFPEHYNARRILDQLPEQIRVSRDFEQLANLIGRGLGLAWQLERVGLLIKSRDGGYLVDLRKELPAIATSSELLSGLSGGRLPLEVDLGSETSPLRRLPESERHWLVDARVRLLAPAFATDATMNALIVLSSKRSDLQFSSEELRFLAGILSPLGLIVEVLELRNRNEILELRNRKLAEGAELSGVIEAPGLSDEILSSNYHAAECVSCGRVYPAEIVKCGKCNLELGEAMVPYALRRMFRFEERIGIGGMAVVYRATDLKLGRSVAIKTLPRISPEAAMRLQQEARTAATVSHPGLAAIYGIETWEGTPMLILEYLEGGTLSERLAKGPTEVSVVVETGLIVAQALEVIHEFGILHRDIKPSNIGYTRHGDAKLLDFGIARIYQDLRTDNEDPSEIVTVDGRIMQQADDITGTLCYFSPEALDDEDPDPTFDLWSLTVVLYEALTARNLFYRPRLKEMLKAIRQAEVPDPSTHVRGCLPELVEFFRLELHPEKSKRSQSGREFFQRLERVRLALGRGPVGARERPAAPLVDLAS